MQERTRLESQIDGVRQLETNLNDNAELIEMGEAEGDSDIVAEAEKALEQMKEEVDKRQLESMLSGEADANDAFLEVNAGAGGTEAQDWAEMLLRMYLRWAERNGYKIEVTDCQSGEEAGIKSVTFLVGGRFAYGYLSAEIGVHRLVRISPFDAGGRRHTSFASVFVTPEIEEDFDIQIDEKDLRVDTYRSSGAGGQHVNVTDSAVRVTHIPSGIVVQCQNERSQHRNRNTAMKILKSRLHELEMEKKRKKLDEVEAGKSEIAWGSQIRSYILQPYRMVKDHRTKMEVGNVDSVLDGGIDIFISTYLKHRSGEKSRKARSN